MTIDEIVQKGNEARLKAIWRQLAKPEREILMMLAERLFAGQREYGEFTKEDSRDMFSETAEELADGVIYLLMHVWREKQ